MIIVLIVVAMVLRNVLSIYEDESCACSQHRGNHQIHDGNVLLATTVDHTNEYDRKRKENMKYIHGGLGYIGTNFPVMRKDGEFPRRAVILSPFLLDATEVSNTDFKDFIDSTGYITEAESFGWSFVFYTALPEETIAQISSAVLGAEWWLPVNGSFWLYPEGPLGGGARVIAQTTMRTDNATSDSDTFHSGKDVFSTGRGNHAVVQVSWHDAQQYCRWRNARLPTEAEWEFAAQGPVGVGLVDDNELYPWGPKLLPSKQHRANIFQGTFPHTNTAKDNYEFIAPVDAFLPQNSFGLYNMVGNVWEWVSDWHSTDHTATMPHNAPTDPTGPVHGNEKVKKGGSFLCHKSYCYRYRTAARYPSTADSGTYNIGFRCARTATQEEIISYHHNR